MVDPGFKKEIGTSVIVFNLLVPERILINMFDFPKKCLT